jgi:hypothetical protein
VEVIDWIGQRLLLAQPPHRVFEVGQRRTRILLVGNLNGRLQLVNNLAKASNAHVVIHSGIVGFVGMFSFLRLLSSMARTMSLGIVWRNES